MPSKVDQPSAPPLLRTWLAGLLLVVGCVFIYRDCLGHGFVMFDDDVNFVFNPHFGALNAERLSWIATEHAVMVRYVPLGWLTCSALASIEGVEPFWFHLAALLMHAASCVALLVLLGRVQRRLGLGTGATQTSRWLGLLPFGLAAWWGWHPLRVEAVAWATTLIYVQAALLGLGSLLALLRAVPVEASRVSLRWLLLSKALLGAALLSHPAAIGFVPLMVGWYCMEACKRGSVFALLTSGSERRRLLQVLGPAVLLGVLALAGTLLVRQMGSVVPRLAPPSLAEFGLGERFAQGCAVLMHFVTKMLWPADLNPIYPLLDSVKPLAPLFLLSILGVLGLLALVLVLLRLGMIAGLPVLATLLTCVPFLGFNEHPYYPCDRYTLVPALGIPLIVLGVAALGAEWRRRSAWCGLPLLLVLLPLWLLHSRQQTRLWADDDSLFEAAASIQTDPPTRDAYFSRSVTVHLSAGRMAAARRQLERLQEAGALKPTLEHFSAKLHAAEKHLAAGGQPPYAELLVDQSAQAARRGDLEGAIERLRRALAIAPAHARARYSLGMLLVREADTRGALAQLLWLRSRPGDLPPDAIPRLASVLAASLRDHNDERQARLVEQRFTRL